ncbi:MAG: prepilin peptidase [Deltaproteobacteria bacterium]|jgi:leader peptidase (prepilin peptidase)/N-methyltransferase|nr:prepilin peptidase [Deltaproteobacteria bacterium]
MEFAGPVAVVAPLVAIAFGLCVGSFLNVVIFRLPRQGLGLNSPRRSFCPSCQAQLDLRDNIPVVSWLLLRGRCRACRAPISLRYPLVELAVGCLSFFVFQAEGFSLRYLFCFYFLSCLTAVAFIDLELMVIPDLLVRPTCLLGLLSAALFPHPDLMVGERLWLLLTDIGWSDLLTSLVGAAAAYLAGYFSLWSVSTFYKIWRGRQGLGDGDPPLMGLIALFLGLPSILPVLLFSTFIALASVVVMLITGHLQKEGLGVKPIPFGPFLSLAAMIWYFRGQAIMSWYLGLLTF